MMNIKQKWDWIVATDYKIISTHRTRANAVRFLSAKRKIHGKCDVHLKSDWKKKEIEPVDPNFIGVDMNKVISFVDKKERIDKFNNAEQLNRDLLRIASK